MTLSTDRIVRLTLLPRGHSLVSLLSSPISHLLLRLLTSSQLMHFLSSSNESVCRSAIPCRWFAYSSPRRMKSDRLGKSIENIGVGS